MKSVVARIAGEEELEAEQARFADADTVAVIDDREDDVAIWFDLGTQTQALDVLAVVVEDETVVEEGFVDFFEGFVFQSISEFGAAHVGCAGEIDEEDAGADRA